MTKTKQVLLMNIEKNVIICFDVQKMYKQNLKVLFWDVYK